MPTVGVLATFTLGVLATLTLGVPLTVTAGVFCTVVGTGWLLAFATVTVRNCAWQKLPQILTSANTFHANAELQNSSFIFPSPGYGIFDPLSILKSPAEEPQSRTGCW